MKRYDRRIIKVEEVECSDADSSIEDLERILEQQLISIEQNETKHIHRDNKQSNLQTPKQLEMRIRLRKKLEKKKISKS